MKQSPPMIESIAYLVVMLFIPHAIADSTYTNTTREGMSEALRKRPCGVIFTAPVLGSPFYKEEAIVTGPTEWGIFGGKPVETFTFVQWEEPIYREFENKCRQDGNLRKSIKEYCRNMIAVLRNSDRSVASYPVTIELFNQLDRKNYPDKAQPSYLFGGCSARGFTEDDSLKQVLLTQDQFSSCKAELETHCKDKESRWTSSNSGTVTYPKFKMCLNDHAKELSSSCSARLGSSTGSNSSRSSPVGSSR